ncbi:ATP-grasp domain-containing protein [Enterovibrio sp. ZSDZ42]|uniref:ATP-grasp domain-containing protein n=2 Tax=Enterovibrio gelatinilyticus TaxID=2899819 RepID=A0ABT5R7E3_9GAMM|nr:ATP-grasp domain-containing protein [Enterovibrio sp. ZSDZ42]MDD1795432.1 ATP-grasp domain-containing protein [Enterovibrio sp. ZSDZ42]
MHRLKLVDEKTNPALPINHGMPPLNMKGKAVSAFEFWPGWIFYAPVAVQWIWYGIKYRSASLPLIANPGIELSGMVGESKDAILSLAGERAKPWILPYVMWEKNTTSAESQAHQALSALHDAGLGFPVVAKPDLGCRGAGVRLVENKAELEDYLRLFPDGARLMLQQKAPYNAEAGVFYVRYPEEKRGRIFSLTLKYNPFVVGDGQRTLAELIDDDPRASKVRHLYRDRHEDKLNLVLAEGETFRLAFAGSHSRGAIFRNGCEFITDALVARLDEIFDDFPGFHYGRIDLKFRDIESLMRGDDFALIEVNGASSEAAHIWDREASLKEAFSTLLEQYRILFEIGDLQRKSGHKVPTLGELYKAWQREKALVRHYPSTD